MSRMPNGGPEECEPEEATWENTPVEGPIAFYGTAAIEGEGGVA